MFKLRQGHQPARQDAAGASYQAPKPMSTRRVLFKRQRRFARARLATVLGVTAIAAALAVLGSSVTAAANSTPPPLNTARWAKAIKQLQVPGKGCFTASYPMVQWRTIRCTTAPHHPYAPAPGHRPQTVGNGTDYSAEVSSHPISSVTGTFLSVSPGTAEMGQQNGSGPLLPNTFSLQLNTNPFTTGACNPSPPGSGCQGWEQFVYSTTFNDVFIQDWLLHYDTTCPQGWITSPPNSPPATASCYINSAAAQMPDSALTAQELPNVTMKGSAIAGGVSVTLTSPEGTASATSATDTLGLGLANNWTGVEWGVFGDCCGTEAFFSPATTLKAVTGVNNGTTPAPSCVSEGFTGETNNLTLAPNPVTEAGSPPTLISTQSHNSSGPPSCATGAGAGGTHLKTFGNLLYSFEAAGDFELATTGPHFTVEDRQIPDTPAWPNAAITQAAAARVGTSDVAICTAPTRLMINNRQVALADGGHLNLPAGSKVSRTGNTYLIQDAAGDSLTAAVNTGSPGWIDTSVGLGRWPETVHGLLANAGTNPDALQARNGTVLTAPFNFSQFYNTYGNSWRVPLRQSLLSACGTKVATSNPANVLYTGNLPPKLAAAARAECAAAGIQAPGLLDACTVDTAVLGTSAIPAYQGLPANVTWGKITPPTANTHTTRD